MLKIFSHWTMSSEGRSQTFSGVEPDIFIWGATGGASFATRGAVNGLCRTFRKRPEKFWGATGGARQNFEGAVPPPGTPLAPPLLDIMHAAPLLAKTPLISSHSNKKYLAKINVMHKMIYNLF